MPHTNGAFLLPLPYKPKPGITIVTNQTGSNVFQPPQHEKQPSKIWVILLELGGLELRL